MRARSRLTLALQRVVLRTGRRPRSRLLWRAGSRAVARGACALLTRGERGASVYERGGSAEDFLPGLSDVDLALVLPDDVAAPGAGRERVARRWRRLSRIAALRLVLDWPRIYEEAELRSIAGESVLSFGLRAASGPRAALFGDLATLDTDRLLARPGLYGSTADWRLLAGPDRRPPEPRRDRQSQRIAAWLELVYWWRWVFPACASPEGPRTADLSVKFVAEAARIWLLLARGERTSGRANALRRTLRALPEEEDALRRTLDVHGARAAAPGAPLEDALRTLLRLSERIAELIAAEIAEAGVTDVRLAGAEGTELMLPRGGGDAALAPLADWRGVVIPSLPDEALEAVAGHPDDPAAIREAALSRPIGPYPVLRSERLLVLAGVPWWRNRLRSIQCRASDPVSFTLLEQQTTAEFPAVPGWAAEDWARRAVAEHLAWLEGAAPEEDGTTLGRLFTAARAALFLTSIREDAPELPLTVVATADRLAARSTEARQIAEDAVDDYRRFCLGREPAPRTVAAMRRLVAGLPPYADRDRSGRSTAQLRSWSRPIQ